MKPKATPIEQIMHRELRRYAKAHKKDGMVLDHQVKIGEYRVDFLIAGKLPPIVVECDGHDFHERTKGQAHRDRQMDRRLQIMGYSVLRFTGAEIWNDIDACIREINQLAFRFWMLANNGKSPRDFLLRRTSYKFGFKR